MCPTCHSIYLDSKETKSTNTVKWMSNGHPGSSPKCLLLMGGLRRGRVLLPVLLMITQLNYYYFNSTLIIIIIINIMVNSAVWKQSWGIFISRGKMWILKWIKFARCPDVYVTIETNALHKERLTHIQMRECVPGERHSVMPIKWYPK